MKVFEFPVSSNKVYVTLKNIKTGCHQIL